MQQINDDELARVCGGESFRDVARALPGLAKVPLDQTYQATIDFIRDHPFFHQGVMNAPIGGGKHFRNVPFVGPSRMIGGAFSGNRDEIRKGWQVTRGTWDAP